MTAYTARRLETLARIGRMSLLVSLASSCGGDIAGPADDWEPSDSTPAVIVPGSTISGISGGLGSQRTYRVPLPIGVFQQAAATGTQLVITTAGGSGDLGLYLRYDAVPTTTTHACMSDVPGNNETCTIDNPQPGDWYVLLRGVSPYSGVTLSAATVTTVGAPGVPTLVSPAHESSTLDTTLLLTWHASANATSYEVQVDDDFAFASPEVSSTTAHPFFTVLNTLAQGGHHFWRVRAQNSSGTWSDWSSVWRFFVQTYAINVSASPENGGTVIGGGHYNAGQQVTVTASPAAGFAFVQWADSGEQVSTSSSYTFTSEGHRNLVALFEPTPPQTYAIAVSASQADGGKVIGGGYYNAGEEVTVTATPAAGFIFVHWAENGGQISTNLIYTFRAERHRSLVAVFTPAPTQSYAIHVSASPAGGGTVNGGGLYNAGEQVTATAVPAAEFTFVHWEEDGEQVSTSPSYSFVATANRSLIAVFAAAPLSMHTINVSALPVNGGTVTGDGTYQHGQEVTVTATPAAGFAFVAWTHNDTQVSTTSSYTFTATMNRDLEASFVRASLQPALLMAPEDGAVGVSNVPTFSWSAVSGGLGYYLLVSTSPSAFPSHPGSTSCSACVIYGFTTTNSHRLPYSFPDHPGGGVVQALSPGTTYYWTVYTLGLFEGRSSEVRSFTTAFTPTEVLTVTPPFDDGGGSAGTFEDCDVGLMNTSGDQSVASGTLRMTIVYDFQPPCAEPEWMLSVISGWFDKAIELALPHDAIMDVVLTYRVIEAKGIPEVGRVHNNFELDIATSSDAGAFLWFPREDGAATWARLSSQCEASVGDVCQPSGGFAPGTHQATFRGRVDCGGLASPCGFSRVATGFRVWAHAMGDPPGAGSTVLDVEVLRFEFIWLAP